MTAGRFCKKVEMTFPGYRTVKENETKIISIKEKTVWNSGKMIIGFAIRRQSVQHFVISKKLFNAKGKAFTVHW